MKTLIAIFLSLVSTGVSAQETVNGPQWIGRSVDLPGRVIGWQQQHDKRCFLILIDPLVTPAAGRLWACNKTFKTTPEWIIQGSLVKVSGRVSGVQKTRVGSQWRWAPKIDGAQLRAD